MSRSGAATCRGIRGRTVNGRPIEQGYRLRSTGDRRQSHCCKRRHQRARWRSIALMRACTRCCHSGGGVIDLKAPRYPRRRTAILTPLQSRPGSTAAAAMRRARGPRRRVARPRRRSPSSRSCPVVGMRNRPDVWTSECPWPAGGRRRARRRTVTVAAGGRELGGGARDGGEVGELEVLALAGAGEHGEHGRGGDRRARGPGRWSGCETSRRRTSERPWACWRTPANSAARGDSRGGARSVTVEGRARPAGAARRGARRRARVVAVAARTWGAERPDVRRRNVRGSASPAGGRWRVRPGRERPRQCTSLLGRRARSVTVAGFDQGAAGVPFVFQCRRTLPTLGPSLDRTTGVPRASSTQRAGPAAPPPRRSAAAPAREARRARARRPSGG
jgi:hypothetical protein